MRRLLCGCGIATAVFLATLGPAIGARQQSCLHGADETAEQVTRRREAITAVRRINSLQILQFANAKKYLPLTALPEIQPPAGFSVQLVTDERTQYAVSAKDVRDPCGFSVFSDQEQVIYTGQPIGMK